MTKRPTRKRDKRRKPEYIAKMEKGTGAGKGPRPQAQAGSAGEKFRENFPDLKNPCAEAAPEDKEDICPGRIGLFARDRVTRNGVSGPRYLLDPGSLLDLIDEIEKGERLGVPK